MSDNLQESCRICLDVESDHILISQDPTIHLHMKSCLDMTISAQDNLPKQICVHCVSQLKDFYNFQLNARCTLDWLEYSVQETTRNLPESKMPLQPLPDSEYNSDSLLEFLNNTANIEDYLNTIGKDDIPSIVGILDKNPENLTETDSISINKSLKLQDTNKNRFKINNNCQMDMEIDVLDSEVEVVQEILTKEVQPKIKLKANSDASVSSCAACKMKFNSINKLSQHMSICDKASRMCAQCYILFDSKLKMQKHCIMHSCWNCSCGKQFQKKELLVYHQKNCHLGNIDGYGYRCKQCNKLFTDRFLLYRHVRLHIKKAKQKICDICGHVFIGEEALVKHRKKEHKTTDILSYRCRVCTFTCADRKEIYLHVHRQHTAHGERNQHLCESCGQSFATYTTLMRHSLQHGTLRYTCSVCDERFASKAARDKHLVKHDEIIICDKCGLSVSCKLQAHVCS